MPALAHILVCLTPEMVPSPFKKPSPLVFLMGKERQDWVIPVLPIVQNNAPGLFFFFWSSFSLAWTPIHLQTLEPLLASYPNKKIDPFSR